VLQELRDFALRAALLHPEGAGLEHSRFYEASPEGLRAMAGFVVFREKVLNPLLAGACNRKPGRKPSNRSQIDIHYENIQSEMQNIFEIIGIAA
jgi:hypothetical protein